MKRCQTVPGRKAASPQTLREGREWWRCCRDKRGALLDFTALNHKGHKGSRSWVVLQLRVPSCPLWLEVIVNADRWANTARDASVQYSRPADESVCCRRVVL